MERSTTTNPGLNRQKLIPSLAVLSLLAAAILTIWLMTGNAAAQSGNPIPKPLNLTATAQTDGTVQLEWRMPASSDYADGFQISRRAIAPGSKMQVIVSDTGNRFTAFTDPRSLSPGNYAYRVRAIYDGTAGPASSAARVTIEQAAAPQPEPTPEPETGTADTEAARLTSVIEGTLHGCLPFEVTGADGETTYTLSGALPDGEGSFRCVPLRDLTEIECIPDTDQTKADNNWYTVVEKDSNFYIIGIHNAFYTKDLKTAVTPAYLKQLNPARLAYAEFVTIKSRHQGNEILLKLETNRTIHEYQVLTEEYETTGPIPSAHPGHMIQALKFLHTRTNRIIDGAEYDTPENCRFAAHDDLRDALVGTDPLRPFGSLSAPETAQGTLNPGNDRDLYEVTLQAGNVYRLSVAAVAPDDVDRSTIKFSDRANEQIDEITPGLRLLDSNGDELATAANGENLVYSPDSDGTHYVEIHKADTPRENAGVYQVTIRLTGEGTRDYAADTSTEGSLTVGGSILQASLGPNDEDWMRVHLTAAETVSLVLRGDAVDIGTSISLKDSSGADLADGTSFYNKDSRMVLTVQVPTDGTYYLAVSGDDTGSYSVKANHDGHMPSTVDALRVITLTRGQTHEGKLHGSWDRDAYQIHVPHGKALVVSLDTSKNPDAGVFLRPDSSTPDHINPTFINGLTEISVRPAEGGLWHDDAPSGNIETITIIVNAPDGMSRPAAYTLSLGPLSEEPVYGADQDPDWIDESDYRTLTDNGDGTYSVTGDLYRADGDADQDFFALPEMPAGLYRYELSISGEAGALTGMVALECVPGAKCVRVQNEGPDADSRHKLHIGNRLTSSDYVIGLYNVDNDTVVSDYTLTLVREPDGTATDAGDNPGTAHALASLPMTGVIADADDVDMYWLRLHANQLVDVLIEDVADDNVLSSNTNAWVTHVVNHLDQDISWQRAPGEKGRSFTFTTTVAGVHYIAVAADDHGSYELTVHPDDYPRSFIAAPLVETGVTHDGVIAYQNDLDSVRFVMDSEESHLTVTWLDDANADEQPAMRVDLFTPQPDPAVGRYSTVLNTDGTRTVTFHSGESTGAFSDLPEEDRTITILFSKFQSWTGPFPYTFEITEENN